MWALESGRHISPSPDHENKIFPTPQNVYFSLFVVRSSELLLIFSSANHSLLYLKNWKLKNRYAVMALCNQTFLKLLFRVWARISSFLTRLNLWWPLHVSTSQQITTYYLTITLSSDFVLLPDMLACSFVCRSMCRDTYSHVFMCLWMADGYFMGHFS